MLSKMLNQIIDEFKYNLNDFYILVDNVLETPTSSCISSKSLNIPIIGITGSNGKTTSKELITDIFQLSLIFIYKRKL